MSELSSYSDPILIDAAHLFGPRPQGSTPLKGSGGGGTSDGMEARVAWLEADVGHIKSDVTSLKTDMHDIRDRMARLEEKVSHLPSKGFSIVVATSAIVIIGGLLTIAPKLQALISATPPPGVTTAPRAGG